MSTNQKDILEAESLQEKSIVTVIRKALRRLFSLYEEKIMVECGKEAKERDFYVINVYSVS